MNAQELFLDVSSGRFLDGDSTIPTTKPAFFSDEVRKIKLFNRRVKNNKITAITPSPDARFKMRLGTVTQKLSDATDVPTAPVNLITALALVVTIPATQATGSGIVATYSPVTATFDATVSTESPVTAQFQVLFRTDPAVTALFKSGISLVTPVTASITVGILTAVTQFIPTTAGSLTSATFSFIPTATFSAAIDRGSNIFNYLAGRSGENLIYSRSPIPLYLTAQMNSPQAAVVCCGFFDGSVSTISIIARGQGYPSGNYDLVFSGGGATAGTVTATAQVAITNGRVGSITLSSGGSGYASAPIATLFTPDKSLLSILPTNALGEVDGKRQFSWVLGRTPGDSARIRFTQPDTTSVVTFNTTPSASLVFVQGNTWQINIENNGYGYVATPTVTHDAAPASTAKITLSRTAGGVFLQSISTAGLLFIRNGGIPLLPEFYYQTTSRQNNILNMAKGIFNDFSPIPGTTTALTLLRNNTSNRIDDRSVRLISELEQSNFAGKDFFATVTVGSTNIGALVRASVPEINLDYDVEVSSVYTNISSFSVGGSKRVDGGGIWETSFEIMDYGDSYTNNFSSSNLVGLLPLKTGSTILQSPIEQVVTIPLQASNGYANTIISQSPTIATRPGRTSTETFISSGGFGFVDRGTFREPVAQAFSGFSATVTSQTVTAGGLIISTTPGIVTTARIIAFPKAYTPGTYDCEVASPATGTRAQIQLIVTSTTASVVILDGGSGYTTAPVITAPAPNGRNGFVNLLVATNAFSGYTAGVINPLEFAPSVATGGTAEGEFEVGESKVTFASRVGIVGGQQALIFNGVSTDPFGRLGVRRKEEPPIPAGSIFLGASNKTVVAESDDGLQEIQQFIQKFAFIRLTNQGFGYTTPPTVLAPAPSRAVGGTIVDIRLTNIPRGYKENQTYALQVTTAPDPLGSSEASFEIFKVNRTLLLGTDPKKPAVRIENPNPDDLKNSFRSLKQFASNTLASSPTLLIADDFYLGLNFTNGFSYTTAPTITAPSPDNDLLGNIIRLLPTNNPVGYRPDTTYPLVIGSSPRLDGGAAGEFTVSSLGVISTRITDGGFGYTTKPSVVAPAPDLEQGTLSGVSVSTLGRGFAPGAYPCNITEAPLGGETASVAFNVNDLGVGAFQVVNKGRGYVTRPIVSVPTQSGNIVSGITITCGGSFYEQITAKFQVLDPSGLGASFGEPIILSGQINQVPIVVGGYGFSANPIIQFSAPTAPVISPLEASAVEGEFNITTASANAILSTATQKDILLEVFETDGTNEQVVAQATVSLAKRVLE